MKKKRLLTLMGSICLALVLMALLLPACAKEEAPVTPAPARPTPVAPAPAPTPVSGLPEVHWKIQSLFPPPVEAFPGNLSVYGQAYVIFERVAKKTNGMFDIKLYIPGALFKKPETLEACRTGAIDGVVGSGAYYCGTVPVATMENNPTFTSKTAKGFYPIIFESNWDEVLRKAYAKHGIYYLSTLSTGSCTFMTNFPIHTGADFKGKILACSGTNAKFGARYGGVPVSYAPVDLYPGLQRGTFDAIFYPLYCGVTYKFFEVAKYAMWPAASPGNCSLVLNPDSWNSLPKEYQDILTETTMEIQIEKYSKGADELNEWAAAQAPKYGVELISVSDEVFNEFRATMWEVFDEYAKEKKDEACVELLNIYKEYFK